jgi:hypothetical protein
LGSTCEFGCREVPTGIELERLGSAADFSGRCHGVEDAGDDLGRACAARFVRRLRFEQLGVREDDAELIVQAVEQETKI